MKKVEIYTDGACSGNPGPGGWGAILVWNGHEKELSGGEAETTNNRMELTAVIEALAALREPCEVVLTSDSKYVIDALTLGGGRVARAGMAEGGQVSGFECGFMGAASFSGLAASDDLRLGKGARGASLQRALRPSGCGVYEEVGKTLEGEGDLLKEVSLPLQTSLSLRELPASPRLCRVKKQSKK